MRYGSIRRPWARWPRRSPGKLRFAFAAFSRYDKSWWVVSRPTHRHRPGSESHVSWWDPRQAGRVFRDGNRWSKSWFVCRGRGRPEQRARANDDAVGAGRGIDAVACDNVYAAVTRIWRKRRSRRILAVGTIQELTREKDAFFRIMAAHVIPCCCLLDKTGPVGRKNLLAAAAFAVRLLDAVADVRSVLEEWRATPPPRGEPRVAPASSGRCRNDVADTSYEEFRATEAELSALLG